MAAHASTPHHRSRAFWYVYVVAAVIGAIGVLLLLGGLYLIFLGGSWYYAPVGLGLMLCAAMLFDGRRGGVTLYLLIWAVTVAWTIWEVSFDWWDWVPRLVAPTVLLVLVLLCIPVLSRTPSSTRRLSHA